MDLLAAESMRPMVGGSFTPNLRGLGDSHFKRSARLLGLPATHHLSGFGSMYYVSLCIYTFLYAILMDLDSIPGSNGSRTTEHGT